MTTTTTAASPKPGDQAKRSRKEKRQLKGKAAPKKPRYNATLLAVLQALHKQAKAERASVFKIRNLHKAIQVVSALEAELVYYYEVQALKTLNERTHEMIGEIIREGRYGEVGPDWEAADEEGEEDVE